MKVLILVILWLNDLHFESRSSKELLPSYLGDKIDLLNTPSTFSIFYTVILLISRSVNFEVTTCLRFGLWVSAYLEFKFFKGDWLDSRTDSYSKINSLGFLNYNSY